MAVIPPEKKYTLQEIQALMGASGTDGIDPNLAALLAGKGGTFSSKSDLAALTNKDMGLDYGMGAAALGGAAIPFIQAMRLRKEARNYKPTDLVPQQSRDIVQTLGQQLNAPATNYGQKVQNLNDARAARMAYAKRAGNSSDYLRALYGSEDMYNKGMRQVDAEGAAEQINRRAAYNAALGKLGSEEAFSAQKNREALAALKQARDINFAKSGESLISGLVNSVVLQNPKEKPDKGSRSSTPPSSVAPYKMSNPMGKPQFYTPFKLDPAFPKYEKPKFVTGYDPTLLDPPTELDNGILTRKYNLLYPTLTP
jgi:hypothetical protein